MIAGAHDHARQPLAPSSENGFARVNRNRPIPRQTIDTVWGYNMAHT